MSKESAVLEEPETEAIESDESFDDEVLADDEKKPSTAEPTKDPAWANKALCRIQALNVAVNEAQRDFDDAASEAKQLKKVLEAKIAELRKEIARSQEPDAEAPLFANADSKAPATEETIVDDSWQDITLREALHGVNKSIVDKLEDAQLRTMGELTNYIDEKGGRHRLTDVPGIGAATAEKIEEALMAFWERRKAEAPKPPHLGIADVGGDDDDKDHDAGDFDNDDDDE